MSLERQTERNANAMSTADTLGDTSAGSPIAARPARRFSNGWPTIPLRAFLAAIFLFGSYAKFTYPDFFDPNASFGFKSSVDSARHGTPLGGLMGPLSDHASVFGHITAVAELLIGLGLLVGLLTRVAALGGIVLVVTIVLSIDWPEVKEYTGNGGWFTSVDLAVAAALSVFLLGGAGPLSLDGAVGALRRRSRAKAEQADAVEPRYTDPAGDLEDSRRRLRGEDDSATGFTGPLPTPSHAAATGGAYGLPPETPPTSPGPTPAPAPDWEPPENTTQQLPTVPSPPVAAAGPDPDSLWNPPRRESDH
jgi:thiosulfate dehydrogenase [quinone] large subunit